MTLFLIFFILVISLYFEADTKFKLVDFAISLEQITLRANYTGPYITGTEYSFFTYDFARNTWEDKKRNDCSTNACALGTLLKQ